jgi:hypothetical protein
MDAATLYTIVTLLDGREHIYIDRFPSVAACEQALKDRSTYPPIRGLPTRRSCERHIRLAPRLE